MTLPDGAGATAGAGMGAAGPSTTQSTGTAAGAGASTTQSSQSAAAVQPSSSSATAPSSTVTAAVAGVAAAAAAAGLNLQPHAKFWNERNKQFSTWFLLLPEEGRRAVVDEAGGPGFPEQGPSAGAELKATDLLLPELTKAGMLAGGGRCLVLFFTRRSVENVTETDTKVMIGAMRCPA
jgi:hypothetical protein